MCIINTYIGRYIKDKKKDTPLIRAIKLDIHVMVSYCR